MLASRFYLLWLYKNSTQICVSQSVFVFTRLIPLLSVKYSYLSFESVYVGWRRVSMLGKSPKGFQAAGSGIRGLRQLRGRVGPTELVRKPSPMT